MSNLEIQVIDAQTDDNLTGMVIDGVPHLYWLRVYKALGITKAHAVEVIKRLTEGVHYRKFTKEGFALLSGTVNVSLTVDNRAKMYYFITSEGYHRAIMEISTGHMNNPEVAAAIDAKKDHMASIYTRYQKGEVLSIAADKAKESLPGDSKTVAIIEENLAIANSFITHICPHLKVDPGLVTSACLTHAEQIIQKQGGETDLTHLKGMLPRVLADPPAYLTPSLIGKLWGFQASRVNDILEKLGYQESSYRISETSGLKHKEWSPTKKGEPHGEWKPITAGHRNGSIHTGYKWYWKESIIQEFRVGLFGESSHAGQSTLAAVGGA